MIGDEASLSSDEYESAVKYAENCKSILMAITASNNANRGFRQHIVSASNSQTVNIPVNASSVAITLNSSTQENSPNTVLSEKELQKSWQKQGSYMMKV